ncbi:MAG: DUF1801 domain-containing protein [Vicinamibacterales bacterium]
MISSARSVAEYLREVPEAERRVLRTLRREIRAAAPDAREFMKYGHPHYDLGGSLFAIARQKHFVALYVAEAAVVRAHRPALEGLSVGKSCIRFRPSQPVPAAIVADLIGAAAAARRDRRRA